MKVFIIINDSNLSELSFILSADYFFSFESLILSIVDTFNWIKYQKSKVVLCFTFGGLRDLLRL